VWSPLNRLCEKPDGGPVDSLRSIRRRPVERSRAGLHKIDGNERCHEARRGGAVSAAEALRSCPAATSEKVGTSQSSESREQEK